MTSLEETESIGNRLRKRRERLSMSIEELAEELQIPQKYLKAFEDDRFEVFSAKVYARGFLKKIMRALAIKDPEQILQEFDTEWEVRTFRKRGKVTPLPQSNSRVSFITPRRTAFMFAGLALLFFLLFFGWRLTVFISNPALNLEEPKDNSTVITPVIRVKGNTEKESHLTVNGRELTIDEAGNFNEEIELASGLNALEFISQNRFGKISRTIRFILVK